MKLAIVNDLNIAVEALRRVLSQQADLEVIWVAKDGQQAVEMCRVQKPDLILMDLIMPVMDGVEATRRIMRETPCAILVVTATVRGNSSKVYEAMGHGALDAVATPSLNPNGSISGSEFFLRKISMIGSLIGQPTAPPCADAPDLSDVNRHAMAHPLLVIGASTGGPQAVAEILSHLPKEFSGAVVLVQHVDQHFAAGLATWLQERCRLPVRIVHPGDQPKPGTVLVAATNDHLILKNDGTLCYTPNPRASSYRPSIDVFFKSIAPIWHGRGCAILLTGMGRDGAEGLLALRKAGFLTIAQDKNSSIVYGMPKAAAELDAAGTILPLGLIGEAVRSHFASSKTTSPTPP